MAGAVRRKLAMRDAEVSRFQTDAHAAQMDERRDIRLNVAAQPQDTTEPNDG